MENDGDLESNTITINLNDSNEYNWGAAGPITISSITTLSPASNWNSITFSGSGSNGSVDAYDQSEFSFINWDGKELIDFMPNLEKVNDMCSMYPGLKIAFDHFRTIYKLVHDDYLERKNSEHD